MTDEERIRFVADLMQDDFRRQCEEGGADAPSLYAGEGGKEHLTSVGIDGRVNLIETARHVLRGLGVVK